MRVFLTSVLFVLLAWAPSVQAATITFGSLSNLSTCSVAGNSADRSCSNTASVSNGALDNVASVNVRGQASADHGITTNPTAIADTTVTYTVPYTVTRTVVVDPVIGGPAEGSFEQINLVLDLTFSGAAANDNSQSFGGLGNATVYSATVSSANGFFSASVLSGGSRNGGTGTTPVNSTGPDRNYAAGTNFSGPVRNEADTDTFGIPVDWRAWEDFAAPHQGDYVNGFNQVQSFTDTLTITFRLRAESRPSGSISATGGEAIACAGQGTPLGGFDLNPNCGSGLTVGVTAQTTGFVTEAVPEPGTLLLVASGLAIIAGVRGRRRKA